ncbi:DUF1016 N-terminal domain-containing protein [Arthrobacter sp. Leaf137]|uniref:DUF1016 N-terminal domain-containing protein n=1 Tax=Arthrobacter sp. Leaf137 TaxID=1736271 RepID=UPI00336A0631
MRAYAAAWDGPEPIVQTPSGQLSWSHNVALLNKLTEDKLRRCYASKAVEHGWSVPSWNTKFLPNSTAQVQH